MIHNGESVLLIGPRYNWWWSAPPLGLGWIATSLEKINKKVELIDCQVTPDYKKAILRALDRCSVAGITSTVGTISSALEISSLIRQNSPKTRIIFGGPHPTAIYEKLLPEYADIVVMGEGEDTITELVQENSLSKIKGIAYWDGSLKVNPSRPPIEDLDRLGFPAWHMFDLKKYRFASAHVPFAKIITSRGCPYNCIYCNNSITGVKIRLRSLGSVLSEIDYLVNKFKTREIRIVDNNFTFYPERVKELCRMIIGKRYKDLRFILSNGVRADISDPQMYELLYQAGFYQIALGVESGSQEVSDKLGRSLNLETVKNTINVIKKAKIEVNLYFIIGLPFDTVETMQKTINFARDLLPVDMVTFYMAVPFPGTRFYDMVKERGRFLRDLATTSFTYTSKAVYEMDSLKSDDMNRMYKKANRKFFLRFPIIKRILSIRIDSLNVLFGLLRYGYSLLFQGGQIKNKT